MGRAIARDDLQIRTLVFDSMHGTEIVGIDLGTTNSLIGVMEAGFPILLADAQGHRLPPSVVFFPDEGAPIVGSAAQRMRALKPASTIYSVKRLMGLRGEDLSDAE